MRSVIQAVLVSIVRFTRLVSRRSLHLKYNRIGKPYTIKRYGTYSIFRETECLEDYDNKQVTLVVGFRLKLLGTNPVLHWMFQRVCVLTTPFWSGAEGFKVKLWMVDHDTKNYLGIYEWSGERQARQYVETLVRVLRPLSVPKSVWFHLHRQNFEAFLHRHEEEADTVKKALYTRQIVR